MSDACPACGAQLPDEPSLRGPDRLFGTPGTFEVYVCPECATGRTMPAVSAEELAGFYPRSYDAHRLPGNTALRGLATLLFRLRYRRALQAPPLGALRPEQPGRLLDVGSGRGDLGVVLREQGWEVTGLEPSEDACEEARGRGVHSVCGTLTTTAGELPGGYDAVVFQHSLEHVADPAADLAAARGLLRDGGLLLVSLPNFGSWQRRRFGGRWFHLDLPRHRTHFSPRGLELLLRRQGFAPLTVATSTSIDGLPGSLQYRLLGRRRLDRGVGRYGVIATSLALAPVSALLNSATGGGDILNAVAVKAEE
ncbi:MAG TPA: class I SAM-dependent methyltransferase [Gaiellaceae bacterium]|nr:class I SAM-dependent methyltransferase [Gaiellaceae bacterium]